MSNINKLRADLRDWARQSHEVNEAVRLRPSELLILLDALDSAERERDEALEQRKQCAAAIDFALKSDALSPMDFLREWNEGDPEAMAALNEWIEKGRQP